MKIFLPAFLALTVNVHATELTESLELEYQRLIQGDITFSTLSASDEALLKELETTDEDSSIFGQGLSDSQIYKNLEREVEEELKNDPYGMNAMKKMLLDNYQETQDVIKNSESLAENKSSSYFSQAYNWVTSWFYSK